MVSNHGEYVDAILRIGQEMGVEFVTNNIYWDGGEEQICIGIPTREQKKRKIWKGFFWVRHASNFLNFWLPDRVDVKALSERTGLEIELAPVTHKTAGKKDSVLAMVSLSDLVLGSSKHKEFIATIIDWNLPSAQRKE
jgi:hypothetical protein